MRVRPDPALQNISWERVLPELHGGRESMAKKRGYRMRDIHTKRCRVLCGICGGEICWTKTAFWDKTAVPPNVTEAWSRHRCNTGNSGHIIAVRTGPDLARCAGDPATRGEPPPPTWTIFEATFAAADRARENMPRRSFREDEVRTGPNKKGSVG